MEAPARKQWQPCVGNNSLRIYVPHAVLQGDSMSWYYTGRDVHCMTVIDCLTPVGVCGASDHPQKAGSAKHSAPCHQLPQHVSYTQRPCCWWCHLPNALLFDACLSRVRVKPRPSLRHLGLDEWHLWQCSVNESRAKPHLACREEEEFTCLSVTPKCTTGCSTPSVPLSQGNYSQ